MTAILNHRPGNLVLLGIVHSGATRTIALVATNGARHASPKEVAMCCAGIRRGESQVVSPESSSKSRGAPNPGPRSMRRSKCLCFELTEPNSRTSSSIWSRPARILAGTSEIRSKARKTALLATSSDHGSRCATTVGSDGRAALPIAATRFTSRRHQVQQLAFTVPNVVAANAAIPAVLEVLNPNTKMPFLASRVSRSDSRSR